MSEELDALISELDELIEELDALCDQQEAWNADNPDLRPICSPWAARIMELMDILEAGLSSTPA
jgi:hypothetical protein